ncbi:MAG: F0F1 ATP synthase subunit B [Eubacteriaceae bacterium]|nr:F0F1 ATP synthase subunit B [Eubacteriaceae bacterium]
MAVTVHESLLALNWNLLFSVVTVLVLFLILKKFFFEKVHNFMVERENEVRNQFETAEEANRLAEQKIADYEERIKNAEGEGRAIIKAARDEAQIQAQSILDEANEKTRKMMEQSEAEILRQKNNARKELKDEIGVLAVMAAEQILQKELTDRNQSEIVDRIIMEAEDESWS